jgi:hypothetical protein
MLTRTSMAAKQTCRLRICRNFVVACLHHPTCHHPVWQEQPSASSQSASPRRLRHLNSSPGIMHQRQDERSMLSVSVLVPWGRNNWSSFATLSTQPLEISDAEEGDVGLVSSVTPRAKDRLHCRQVHPGVHWPVSKLHGQPLRLP